MGKYLTVTEAAKMFVLTPKAIREKIARREFPFVKVGTRILISEAELLAFLAAAPSCTAAEAARNLKAKAA